MKLEIDREETEAALLEWAERRWPGCFNKVEVHSYRGAEFSKEAARDPETEPAIDDLIEEPPVSERA